MRLILSFCTYFFWIMWTLCPCSSAQSMDFVTSVSDAVKTESLLMPSSSVELKEITQVSRFKHSPTRSNVSRKRTGCGVSTPCITNKCRKVSNGTDEDAESASDTKAGFLLHEHANDDFYPLHIHYKHLHQRQTPWMRSWHALWSISSATQRVRLLASTHPRRSCAALSL